MKYQLKPITTELNTDYEIIVLGGGPSGVAAAIASAREGKKTLLIEASGMLGGMATKGLVSSWTPYTDGEKIIYGGISKSVFLENKQYIPNAENKFDWVTIDFEHLKTAYDRRVREAGADILFYTMFVAVEMADERNIDKIIVANKSGLTAYKAKVYIDCTGDADLYAFAGGKYAFGDDKTHDVQPSTLCFIISGVNEREYKKYPDLYGGNTDSIIRKIVDDGKYDIPDYHLVNGFIAPNTIAFNAGHIWGVDNTNPKSVSEGIIRGRILAREYFNALKEYMPSVFSDSYLVETAPTIGVRESRRIIGDYTFTLDDFLERRTFPDEIARNNYFIDIHKSKDELKTLAEHSDNRYEHYKTGESHGVPYRILCPKAFDNFLVAGRTVSTDRITQGSLRIMPCCLCEGEAAGIAAAMACENEQINIHTVNTDKLRKKLIDYGAYLPKLKTDKF